MCRRTDKLNFIRINKFCSSKDSAKKMKDKPDCEKTTAMHISDKGHVPKQKYSLLLPEISTPSWGQKGHFKMYIHSCNTHA